VRHELGRGDHRRKHLVIVEWQAEPVVPGMISLGGARLAPDQDLAWQTVGTDEPAAGIERLLVRLIATFGIIGIGVALGAILAASKVQGWIIGLVVAAVSVILAGLLWSSRQL